MEEYLYYNENWLIPNSNIFLLNKDNYNTLIKSININFIILLFIASSFSTIVFCIRKDKIKYSQIPISEIVEINQ